MNKEKISEQLNTFKDFVTERYQINIIVTDYRHKITARDRQFRIGNRIKGLKRAINWIAEDASAKDLLMLFADSSKPGHILYRIRLSSFLDEPERYFPDILDEITGKDELLIKIKPYEYILRMDDLKENRKTSNTSEN